MKFKSARVLVAVCTLAALPVFAQNIAVVNGKPIPTADMDAMVKQLVAQGQQDTPQLRSAIKEELITRAVFMQEAEKQGIAQSPDVKTQLEMARQSILARGLISNYLAKNPVKDSDIQAEYTKYKAMVGDKEYHARHILVETEAQAKDIIAKLKSGSKFEDLAKQSKDPGSANNGGDLDWASPASFVKPFSDAMVSLKAGEYTQTPIHTQFGYHIIKLDAVRPAKVATLEEMKPQIVEMLQQQKLQEFQENLRKSAKVQ